MLRLLLAVSVLAWIAGGENPASRAFVVAAIGGTLYLLRRVRQ